MYKRQILGGVACCGALALAAVLALRRAGRASAQADQVLARYSAGSGEEIAALAEDYRCLLYTSRCV